MRTYNYWTNNEIKYLKNNYSGGETNLIRSNLNRHSPDCIKVVAFNLGLKRREINMDFFKYWNKEMAYTFGFWTADGNMGKNNNRISFCSKDYDLITIIKSALNSNHKIGNSNGCFNLTISNKIMYNDLLKLGGIPAKSLIIQFPEVPDKYLSHFIRGYFDGNGCFYIQKDKRRIHSNEYLGSNFCGNIDFLSAMKIKIKENANIDKTGCYITNKRPNRSQRIYSLLYFGKKAIALGDYIYQNSENLRLERKFKIYNKMKKEYLKKLKI